jgi:hypothetical protein
VSGRTPARAESKGIKREEKRREEKRRECKKQAFALLWGHAVASFPGETNRLPYVPKMSGKTEALDLVAFEAGLATAKKDR